MNETNKKECKTGTLNLGYHYEEVAPAFFSLLLLQDETVEDFTIHMNKCSFEKFDDVIIKIVYKNKTSENFAIQLKHREPGNNILDASREFHREKKPFWIQQYRDSYNLEKEKRRNKFKFILYTNAKFKRINKVKDYVVHEKVHFLNTHLFPTKAIKFNEDTSSEENCFKTRDYFFDDFFLFHTQKNYDEMKKEIITLFRNLFNADENFANRYIDFFTDVHRASYKNTNISRDEVIIQLLNILTEHLVVKPTNSAENIKNSLIEEALQQFYVTLLTTKSKIVAEHWKYNNSNIFQLEKLKEMKLVPKNYDDTLEEEKLRRFTLHYIQHAPMFITVKKESEDTILKILQLCKTLKNTKLVFVLLEADNLLDKLPDWKTFKTLADLKGTEVYNNMINTFTISLQGRKPITIYELINNYNFPIDEYLKPEHIFRFLEKDLIIGVKIPTLPEPYIKRNLRKSSIRWDLLEKFCETKPVIIQCNEKSAKFYSFLKEHLPGLEIIGASVFTKNPSHYKKMVVVISNNKLIDENCHCFKLSYDNSTYILDWVDTKISISETIDNQINAVCDNPGAGKTTFINYLAQNYPPDYWIIRLSLKQLDSHFTLSSCNVNHLIDSKSDVDKLDQDLLNYFKENKKIVFLLDSLDELSYNLVKETFKFITTITHENYKIWIICTEMLKNNIQNNLRIHNIYNIEELKKEEQITFIENILEKAGKTKQEIKDSIDYTFTKNRKICSDFLKFPLYLFIMSNILSKDIRLRKQKQLTIAEMYFEFIEGKFHHFFEKTGYQYHHIEELFKNFYLEECQIAALKFCLNPQVFDTLKIVNKSSFLKNLKSNRDLLDLLIAVDNKDPVFLHKSFAEYLSAIWLVDPDNFPRLPENQRRFLFSPRYGNIKKFFDMQLAENQPLHLAIIHKNFQSARELFENHKFEVDKGGRNITHLVASLATFHPELTKSTAIKIIKKVKSKTREQNQLLKFLLPFDTTLSKKDELFGWDPFDYSKARASFHVLELFLSDNATLQKTIDVDSKYDLYTLFFYCVFLGYIKILQKLISSYGWNSFVELESSMPKPYLHLAIENHQQEIAALLIDNNIDCSKVDYLGKTALHEAALYGYKNLSNLLIEKEVNVEARDSQGRTPFQFAAKMGRVSVMNLLADQGADIETTDNLNRRKPIHKAAYTGKVESLKFLIEKKDADINALDDNDKSALQRAAEMGHLPCVKYLVSKGINKETIDRYGRTPLHYAALEGHTEIVEYLVKHNTRVSIKDEDGNTPAMLATRKHHDKVAKILEETENDEEQKCNDSTSQKIPLHIAAQDNNLSELKKLISNGANIEETNEKKETALHIAAFEGHHQIVQELLKHNANSAATNKNQKVPLHLAVIRGHLEVVRLLLNRGQNNAPDKWEKSPYQNCAFKGHLRIVQAFVEAGVDINQKSKDGGSALHSAAREGHPHIVEWLLDNKADIKAKTTTGKTALHVAAQRGNLKVVEKLLQTDQSVIDEIDDKSRTALHWASEKGFKSVVKLLIEKRAKIDISDSANETPLDIANRTQQRDEIVKYLQK